MAIKPVRIRFDDVITSSSDSRIKGKEVQKLFKHINWCSKLNVSLTPAILCKDIEQFPEGIALIRKMTKEGLIYPDLHGWDHGPYGDRSQNEIEEHLEKSLRWFNKNLDITPIRWITPHGADSLDMRTAASKFNLIIETTDYPVIDQKILNSYLRTTRNIDVLKNRIIMVHYWERGLRLYRIARIIEFQNIGVAIRETRKELSEKDHKICWAGW